MWSHVKAAGLWDICKLSPSQSVGQGYPVSQGSSAEQGWARVVSHCLLKTATSATSTPLSALLSVALADEEAALGLS